MPWNFLPPGRFPGGRESWFDYPDRMAQVLTVMNMKGGVGKTVVAAHLAGMLTRYHFANRTRKVLLIDYDPQFNTSQALLPSKTYFDLEKAGRTSRAIIQDPEDKVDPFVIQTPGNSKPPSPKTIAHRVYTDTKTNAYLDLVPSTLDLMYVAVGQPAKRTEVFEERFHKFIALCRKQYDVVIIDCHPAGSILTKTSLQESDHVLVPVSESAFAARGIALMVKFVAAVATGKGGPTVHVLLNNLRRQDSAFETTIRSKHGNTCLTHPLRHFKAFADPSEGKGFVWVSHRPHSTRAFSNLQDVVGEVVTRLNL